MNFHCEEQIDVELVDVESERKDIIFIRLRYCVIGKGNGNTAIREHIKIELLNLRYHIASCNNETEFRQVRVFGHKQKENAVIRKKTIIK